MQQMEANLQLAVSIVSSHPEARVRRHGSQLLFNSTSYSDGGFYCCRYSVENLGCTSSSTVRITVVARKARKLVTITIGHSIAERILQSCKPTPSGMIQILRKCQSMFSHACNQQLAIYVAQLLSSLPTCNYKQLDIAMPILLTWMHAGQCTCRWISAGGLL